MWIVLLYRPEADGDPDAPKRNFPFDGIEIFAVAKTEEVANEIIDKNDQENWQWHISQIPFPYQRKKVVIHWRDLVKGEWYKIKYKSQLGNYRWYEYEMCAQYIGEGYEGILLFSLRPSAGTQDLSVTRFISAEPSAKNCPKLPFRIREIPKEVV